MKTVPFFNKKATQSIESVKTLLGHNRISLSNDQILDVFQKENGVDNLIKQTMERGELTNELQKAIKSLESFNEQPPEQLSGVKNAILDLLT